MPEGLDAAKISAAADDKIAAILRAAGSWASEAPPQLTPSIRAVCVRLAEMVADQRHYLAPLPEPAGIRTGRDALARRGTAACRPDRPGTEGAARRAGRDGIAVHRLVVAGGSRPVGVGPDRHRLSAASRHANCPTRTAPISTGPKTSSPASSLRSRESSAPTTCTPASRRNMPARAGARPRRPKTEPAAERCRSDVKIPSSSIHVPL